MSIQDMIAGGSESLVLLPTLIEIALIKLDPWSAVARWLGRCINADTP